MRVKRLDAAKVFVSLSRLDGTNTSASVGAQVGVEAQLARHLPDLGGGVFEKAGEIAAEQVEKQLERWLRADIRAVHSRGQTESEVTNDVVDLTTPEGHKIYEDLLRLDTRAADAALESGDGFSVRRAKLTEGVRSRDSALSANFGRITLSSSVSRATETHGVLETSQGNVAYHRAKLEDGYSGILSNLWSGKRSISRELISTVRDGAAPEYHHHVHHRIDGDGVTSADDVRRFLLLGSALGAESSATVGLVGNKGFLKSFGDSDRNVDVFFTQEGLKKLVEVEPSALLQVHAGWYQRLDEPSVSDKGLATPPWLLPEHPKYAQAIALLEKGPEASSGRQQAQTRDQKYARLAAVA